MYHHKTRPTSPSWKKWISNLSSSVIANIFAMGEDPRKKGAATYLSLHIFHHFHLLPPHFRWRIKGSSRNFTDGGSLSMDLYHLKSFSFGFFFSFINFMFCLFYFEIFFVNIMISE
uniref:Uncharacterized protein n=1 Tax=Manihot esculenta TaxID=3983 RepID=A0A2C9VJ02_MANES